MNDTLLTGHPYYDAVMQWVGLFLFNQGLTTFAGKHVNQALLFPMWEIFEDFVANCFRRYGPEFSVRQHGPQKYLVKDDKNRDVFALKPDISLMSGGKAEFILDTKWKRMNGEDGDLKHDVNQADMYQMYVYGKKYDCRKVALVYPRMEHFSKPLHYKFDDQLSLACFPFDVTKPKCSVEEIIQHLQT